MNLDIIEALNILLKRDKISYTELARRLGTTPQNISQTLKKKDIGVNKIKEIAAAAGYDLIFDFKKIR